ncbi:MAG: iron ABC transporter permease [Eubacterium sp.]|nr:iron ABC transporter permease [Eubacterium sp.]
MKKRNIIIYSILILLLLFLIILNLITGSTQMSFSECMATILDYENETVNGKILWDIRIPRTLAAFILGGALALAGYLLQAFFSNPIAGPYVLGISSGAKLMVAFLMIGAVKYGSRISSVMMILASFLGAIIATSFVIIAAGRVKSMSILIVCGVMIGYICSAVTDLMVSFADDSNIVNLHNWSKGSFSSISWLNVKTFLPVVLIGLIMSIILSKGIEAYLYGEAYAFSLGMNVKVFRIILIVVSSLLSATVTAFAGPISFVGIAVPHIMRKLFKTSKPRIIIAGSFLGGGVFCLLSDLIARSLFSPMELSISTVTAIFGAPVVISMLISRKRGD